MRQKILTKEMIIEKAEALIRDEGVGKCSMRRLSKELGIASGTLYNYYDTRQVLLEEVFIHSWRMTITKAKTICESVESTLEGLKALAALLIEDISNRGGLGKELLSSDSAFEERGKAYLDEAFKIIFDSVLVIDNPKGCNPKYRNWLIKIIIEEILNDVTLTEEDWRRLENLCL